MLVDYLRMSCWVGLVAVVLAPACVIESDDDDGASSADAGPGTGSADESSDSAGSASDSTTGNTSSNDTSGPGDGSDTAVDATGDPSGGSVVPESGSWLYAEVGQGSSDCDFIGTPTNGFGEYVLTVTGDTSFTILPGDETDPFDCDLDGTSYDCPQRLVDTIPAGNVSGDVIVQVVGDFESSTSMSGSQEGRVECVGSAEDCAAAETFLGTSFPCHFSVPFTGTKL